MDLFTGVAYAMAPSGAAGQSGGLGAIASSLMPMVLIFIIFWFLFFRPQQKRAKAHREMVAAIKKGDEIFTDSGIRGTVQKVDADLVTLEIAPKVAIRLQRGRVADVVKPGKGDGDSGGKDATKAEA